MTYEAAEFNADILAQIIHETIKNGGNAAHLVADLEPEVTALLRVRLTHSEKRVCGMLRKGEADKIESRLRTMARDREMQRELAIA